MFKNVAFLEALFVPFLQILELIFDQFLMIFLDTGKIEKTLKTIVFTMVFEGLGTPKSSEMPCKTLPRKRPLQKCKKYRFLSSRGDPLGTQNEPKTLQKPYLKRRRKRQ